jgi:hypothetical protein
MQTVLVEQADLARLVPEYYEVLAEKSDDERKMFELGRDQEWMPIASQILAARRSSAYAGEKMIVDRRVDEIAPICPPLGESPTLGIT